MATEYSTGRIVTNGLVLSLDAADRNSYPTTGTTWNDLSGRGINSTLTNGPTYSSSNGGQIFFDGTNDYVVTTSTSITQIPMTLCVWFYTSGFTTCSLLSIQAITSVQRCAVVLGSSGTIATFHIGPNGGGTSVTTATANLNAWNYACCVFQSSTSRTAYINNNAATTNTANVGTQDAFQQISVAARYTTSWGSYYSGNVAIAQIYSRALSASELLQNYNATKSRFGL